MSVRQTLARGLSKEMANQCADVLRSLPQRRQMDGNHVQAIIEVLPKAPFADHRHQITIGRRDDAHIYADFLPPSDAANPAGLQCAQQPRLRFGRHVPDFVEKQRPAIRLLELADLLADSSGEGSALVTEELAFKKIVRNGCHVDRHERPRLARTELVDGFRHQFLACTTLAGDQDR